MNLTPIFEHLDANREETIETLRTYVGQPSVSVGDGAGMRECAELVAGHYRAAGCQEVEVIETETFPGVWAYYDAGAPTTLLVYNMYDVRSVGDPSRWQHEPFAATIEPRGAMPAVLYGRGAHVPKGPAIAFISAVRAISETTGTLPVNLAFLAEGDEILGSESFPGLMARYRDRVAKADGWIYFRASQNESRAMPISLGYKTFITFELRATGAAWGRGPVTAAAHTATGPIVDNPAVRLVQALATLFNPDGTVAIEGWAPTFASLKVPDDDRALVDGLLERFRGKTWSDVIPGLAGTGVTTYAGDATGDDVLVRYIYGSQLNLQGIYAGYTGPGTRTYTIPERATARFDTRLVTTASPAELMKLLRDHLDAHGFADLEIDLKSAYPGSQTLATTPLAESFLRAVRKAGADPVVWPRQGYGGPWSGFATEFGRPVVH
ncbi:MAG: M20/M25/M40 family metallo-hydrolase, partial [Candidatus Dormiibacterota bacterium]